MDTHPVTVSGLRLIKENEKNFMCFFLDLCCTVGYLGQMLLKMRHITSWNEVSDIISLDLQYFLVAVLWIICTAAPEWQLTVSLMPSFSHLRLNSLWLQGFSQLFMGIFGAFPALVMLIFVGFTETVLL